MKSTVRIVLLLVLMLTAAVPLTADAAGKKGEVVMKVGNKVHLFHSGKVAAQKDVAIGDVLPVYRQTVKPEQEKEVGQVKVTGYVGEHYFEAQIVKGDVKVGDIAKKKDTGMLIQSPR